MDDILFSGKTRTEVIVKEVTGSFDWLFKGKVIGSDSGKIENEQGFR